VSYSHRYRVYRESSSSEISSSGVRDEQNIPRPRTRCPQLTRTVIILLSKDGHCRGIHRPARGLLLTAPEFVASNSFTSRARCKRVGNARGEFHFNALTALIVSQGGG